MEVFFTEGMQIDEKCPNLLLLALSIGNVGQLAVDILIPTLKAERTGYLDNPYVLPYIGNDAYCPYPRGELALPLQVYQSYSNSWSLLQQRSPFIKGMMVECAKNPADFAATSGKKHVFVISILDFGRWQSINMSNGLQIYYISSSDTDRQDDDCERPEWKRLEEYNPQQRIWKLLSSLVEGNTDHKYLDELKEYH